MIQEKQILESFPQQTVIRKKTKPSIQQEKVDVHVKIDRLSDYIEARIFQIKSELLKWIVGSSLLQVAANFASNHWGF